MVPHGKGSPVQSLEGSAERVEAERRDDTALWIMTSIEDTMAYIYLSRGNVLR